MKQMTTHVRIIDSAAEREACYRIRKIVFVEEQKVPIEEELDELEDVCTHFLATPEPGGAPEGAVGTARLWVTPEGEAKAQRVAVLQDARTGGIGRALMDALEAEAHRLGHASVILGAQLTAIPFYERLGYEAYGPEFDDAGIPHRMMKKALNA
jgi:predicted GNAT family N-acyltransferase